MKFKKILFIIIIIVFLSNTLFISYKFNLNDLPKSFINLIKYKYNKKNTYLKIDFLSLIINKYKSKNIFIDFEIEKINKNDLILYNEKEPIIYIYNTHTNEEYNYSKNNLYNITPTVKTASYMLESKLKELGIESVVEESNTIDIINKKGMSYSSSYKVSREQLENKKLEYPSLIYFIDLHRDSVERDITTITINNQKYARIMFLLGLENENCKENKIVMESLNNYLDQNYKGLSRGIYEKSGYGVNGIYNQDFNKNVLLIEVGGIGNTIDEVANSINVIADMLSNYITSNKTTNID